MMVYTQFVCMIVLTYWNNFHFCLDLEPSIQSPVSTMHYAVHYCHALIFYLFGSNYSVRISDNYTNLALKHWLSVHKTLALHCAYTSNVR